MSKPIRWTRITVDEAVEFLNLKLAGDRTPPPVYGSGDIWYADAEQLIEWRAKGKFNDTQQVS